MLASGDSIGQLAVLIKNLNFQIPEDVPRLLVVGNLRFRWPAAAVERLTSFRPAAAGFEVLDGAAWNQERLLSTSGQESTPARRKCR